MRPPRSRSTTRRPRSISARALGRLRTGATLENLKIQLELLHDPRADLRAHQRGRCQGRQFRAARPISRRSPPSIRSRRSMSRSRLPQRALPDLRQALAAETATVDAIIAGRDRAARSGQVSMIENTVDPTTGMVMVRATMPNNDELLWPGTLVTAQVDVARGRGGDGAVAGRPGQPDRAPSSSSSRTAWPRCGRSRSTAPSTCSR